MRPLRSPRLRSPHRAGDRHALLAPLCAAALACASAAPSSAVRAARVAPPAGRPDLVPVSRTLTAIDAAERRGDARLAVQLAEEAALRPEDVAARFLAVSAEPPGEARWNAMRELATAFPRSALPWIGMARIYVGWRTWDQVDRALAEALRREPDGWLALRVRAQAAEARGALDAAAADDRAVLAQDPQNPEAHLGLARIARARGDLVAAHDAAAAALEGSRELPGAWALLAELAETAGEPAAAIDFWRGAVAAAPRDREGHLALARLLRARGDAAGAAAELGAAAALREDAQVRAAQVEAARAGGDEAAEAAALERLVQLEPEAGRWKRLAGLRLRAGDLAGAERAYGRALETGGRDPEVHLGLGRLHLARGEPDEAVRELRAAGPAGEPELAALGRRLNLAAVKPVDPRAWNSGGVQLAVQAQVERTYRARLAEAPSLAGTLRLRVTIDAAGAATLVEALEDSVHDPDVLACASWNLRDAIYPAGQPGRYTFAFKLRR